MGRGSWLTRGRNEEEGEGRAFGEERDERKRKGRTAMMWGEVRGVEGRR